MKLKTRVVVVLTAFFTMTGVLLLMETGVKPISAIYDRVSPGQLDFRTNGEEMAGGRVRDIGPQDQPAWGGNGLLRHQLGKSASRSGGSPSQQNYTGAAAGNAAQNGAQDEQVQKEYSDKLPRSSGANDLNSNFTKPRINEHSKSKVTKTSSNRPPGFPLDPNFYKVPQLNLVTQPLHPPETHGKYDGLFRDYPSTYQVPDQSMTLMRPSG